MVKLAYQEDNMVAIQIVHIGSGCQVHGVICYGLKTVKGT